MSSQDAIGAGAMKVQDPRKEQRRAAIEPVELCGIGPPIRTTESTHTQNLSPRGARVLTQRIWQPEDRLQVRALHGGFRAEARVVYWRSFSSSKFAIGLEFLAQSGTWPARAASPDGRSRTA